MSLGVEAILETALLVLRVRLVALGYWCSHGASARIRRRGSGEGSGSSELAVSATEVDDNDINKRERTSFPNGMASVQFRQLVLGEDRTKSEFKVMYHPSCGNVLRVAEKSGHWGHDLPP